MKIEIPQEKYPIKPVMKAMKDAGFSYSKKKSAFVGEVTEQNKGFLKLLGYIKEWTQYVKNRN